MFFRQDWLILLSGRLGVCLPKPDKLASLGQADPSLKQVGKATQKNVCPTWVCFLMWLARACPCLENTWHQGECTLSHLIPHEVTVYNQSVTNPRQKRAIGLTLAGMGATIGSLTPRGGLTYHEVVTFSLTNIIEAIAWQTADTLSGLQVSLEHWLM